MAALRLEEIKLQAGILFHRQGPWPFVAAAMCLLAVLFALLVIPGQISATENARQELARLQAEQLAQRAKPESERISPARALARVLADPHDTNGQIGLLLSVAATSGVAVAQADYRRNTDSQQTWTQLQIAMPVKADYLALRKFIFAALAAMPSLSLDQLTLKREQAANSMVEAQLVFSIWQRVPEAGAK